MGFAQIQSEELDLADSSWHFHCHWFHPLMALAAPSSAQKAAGDPIAQITLAPAAEPKRRWIAPLGKPLHDAQTFLLLTPGETRASRSVGDGQD
jgi:hypothetical protein